MPFTSDVLEEIFKEIESVDLDIKNNQISNLIEIFQWFDLYADQVNADPKVFFDKITEDKKETFLQKQEKEDLTDWIKNALLDKLDFLLLKDQMNNQENEYSVRTFESVDKNDFDNFKHHILAYSLDLLNKEEERGAEEWIEKYILPRYRYISKFSNIEDLLKETKNNIEIILLENCGITINQNERNSSYRSEEYRKKSIKHVTKYLSKNNWLHMPAEDYERLYKYYIQDMVSVFLQYHIDKIKALPGQCFIFKKMLASSQ